MTNNHSKLFSDTRPKPGTFTGTIQQTINLAPPYGETLRNVVNSGIACAISFINQSGDLQHLFAPVLLPQVDGSPSTTSLGNTSNIIGWLGPASIDFSVTHFLALMSESDMDQLGIPKPQQSIPEEVAEENALTGLHYLVAAPKVILGHFKLEYPTGPIDDVSEQYQSNGPGYEAWLNLTKSALTPAQQATIKRIFEHVSIRAAPASFIRDMPNNIGMQGPATTATCGTFEAYPNQMKKLKEAFQLPASNPSIPSANVAQVLELTTGADKQQQFTSDRGLMKIRLLNVGGTVNVDEGTIDVSTLARPVETKSMEVITSAPSGNRHEMFFDQIRCLIKELTQNGDPMNTLSLVTMALLPSDACKLLLNGSLQTELLIDINDEKQLNSIGAATFMPHDTDDSLLAQHIQDEENQRNVKSASLSSSVPKKVRVVLTSLDKVNERSAIKILINGRAVFLVLIDYEEMERRGTPAIFSQITLKVLDWLTIQVDRKNASWKRATKEDMAHLGYVYYSLVDSMYIAFARFANSLRNQEILEDKAGDLSKLDISDLKKFLKVFKSYRDKFETLQIMNAAHVDVPAIARGLVKKTPSVPTVSPSVADRQQRQQQQQQPDRPNHKEQRAPKKQKPNPPQPTATNPTAGGMLILYEGKEVADAVPGSLNICPYFVAKGYSCLLRNECPKTHPFNLTTVSVRDRKTWCQHLKNSKAGYFSKWRVKDTDTSGPEYAGLIGNTTEPPARA